MKDVLRDLGEISLKDVISQMEKDLQMSGNGFLFKSTEPDDLVEELRGLLKKIDQQNGLDSLFYRIDFDPMGISISEDNYLLMSIKLWNRIFKKVWFRKKYQG